MGTDRPRIQAYVEPELYNYYQGWKQERGIEGDSAALNELLREFFGEKVIRSEITSPGLSKEDIEELIAQDCEAGLEEIKREIASKLPTKPEIDAKVDDYLEEKFKELNVFRVEFKNEVWLQLKSQFAIWNQTLQEGLLRVNGRLDAVEDKLDIKDGMPSLLQEALHTVEQQRWVIEDLLGKSKGELPGELLDEMRSPQDASTQPEDLNQPEVDVEQAFQQKLEPQAEEEIEKTEESNLPSELLTQTELAKRLNCHKSLISRHKKGADFASWSRGKDPDGVAWQYDRKKERFLPVGGA